MVAEGAYKSASLNGDIKSFIRNVGGRKEQRARLQAKAKEWGYRYDHAAEIPGMTFKDQTDAFRRSNKYMMQDNIVRWRVEDARRYAKAIGVVSGIGLTGSGIYAATRDNEKTAEKTKTAGIPFGLMTFMTQQIGEPALKHGISEGIRGIRNMMNYKPSSKPLPKPVEKVKDFTSKHVDAINHLTDTDKWRAAGKIVSDVSNYIG